MRSLGSLLARHSRAFLAGAVSAILLTPAAAQDAEKIDLRLRADATATARARMSLDMTTESRSGGKAPPAQTVAGFRLILERLGREDPGPVTIRVTYDRVHGRTRDMAFDTDDPSKKEDERLRPAFAVLRESFLLKVKASGEVQTIEGLADLEARVAGKLGGTADVERDSRGAAELSRWMKEVIELVLAFHPDGPVAVGESWSRPSTITTGAPCRAERTWTLRATADGSARLDLRAELKPFVRTPDPKKPDELFLRQEYSGREEGTLEMDRRTGWPVRANLRRTLSGVSSLEGLKALQPSDRSQDEVTWTIIWKPAEGG